MESITETQEKIEAEKQRHASRDIDAEATISQIREHSTLAKFCSAITKPLTYSDVSEKIATSQIATDHQPAENIA